MGITISRRGMRFSLAKKMIQNDCFTPRWVGIMRLLFIGAHIVLYKHKRLEILNIFERDLFLLVSCLNIWRV